MGKLYADADGKVLRVLKTEADERAKKIAEALRSA